MSQAVDDTKYDQPRLLAQYIEAEWGDMFQSASVGSGSDWLLPFASRTVNFYTRVAADIAGHLPLGDQKVLDFGCGIGRLCFELSRLRPQAEYNLWDKAEQFRQFSRAMLGEDKLPASIPVFSDVTNRIDNAAVPPKFFDISREFRTRNIRVQGAEPKSFEAYDLVACMNVIDRIETEDQDEFCERLFNLVKSNGLVAMSTPYDYEEPNGKDIKNLSQVFDGRATVIFQTNHDYIMRAS